VIAESVDVSAPFKVVPLRARRLIALVSRIITTVERTDQMQEIKPLPFGEERTQRLRGEAVTSQDSRKPDGKFQLRYLNIHDVGMSPIGSGSGTIP
jgi:hypothetical protein